MLKEKISLTQDYHQINHKCYCCNSLNHSITSCPYMHYLPNSEINFVKSNFDLPTQRRNFERARDTKYRSFENKQKIETCCYQFRFNESHTDKIDNFERENSENEQLNPEFNKREELSEKDNYSGSSGEEKNSKYSSSSDSFNNLTNTIDCENNEDIVLQPNYLTYNKQISAKSIEMQKQLFPSESSIIENLKNNNRHSKTKMSIGSSTSQMDNNSYSLIKYPSSTFVNKTESLQTLYHQFQHNPPTIISKSNNSISSMGSVIVKNKEEYDNTDKINEFKIYYPEYNLSELIKKRFLLIEKKKKKLRGIKKFNSLKNEINDAENVSFYSDRNFIKSLKINKKNTNTIKLKIKPIETKSKRLIYLINNNIGFFTKFCNY